MSEAFNRSELSRFINSPTGRAFRIVAGIGFLFVGLLTRQYTIGLFAIAGSILPLSGGAFDVCYTSAALGGPLSGPKIRALRAMGASSRQR